MSHFPSALDIAHKVLDGPEFRHYKRYREQILGRLEQYSGDVEAQVRLARSRVTAATQNLAGDRTTRLLALVASISGALVAICLLFAYVTLLMNRELSSASRVRIIFLSALLTVPLGAVSGITFWQHRLRALRNRAEVSDTENAYLRELTARVEEAITKAINDELGQAGIVAFPTHAPRLVELDTSQTTSSRTIHYVKDFIREHESSAIGLAGDRGSGKSTVMRAIKADQRFDPYVALVSSPVKYDAGEFMRRLSHEIAVTIAGPGGHSQPVNRVARTRGALFAGLGAVAILFLAGQLFDFSVGPYRLGSAVWLGLGAMLVAVAGLVHGRLNRPAAAHDFRGPSDVRQARLILQDLRWEAERGSTSKNTAKLWSAAEVADEDSWKLKSRALSHSDVVTELRHLLKLFADTNPDRQLVVCIDELDKLDQPEHLVDVVNELKDLFHIQGVHFVVSLSTDALESFVRRGLPSRDAFDSAFDAVVHTDWFTLEESLDVLSKRATGFALPIAKFCHAWSGGLARDLLRTARAAVKLQRDNPKSPVPIGDIVTTIVLDDLAAATNATLRTLDPDHADLAALCDLKQLLDDVRSDARAVIGKIRDLTVTDAAHQVLQARAVLGLHLVEASGELSGINAGNEWNRPVCALADRVSTAMAVISGPKPLRDQAVTNAVDGMSLDPEHPGGQRG